VLEAHSHCEVPAGCGGVVLQWRNPSAGLRNETPNHHRCDFGRFAAFAILPMRTFPPNGYGLYAMNGGVWEWVQDWYDREAYQRSAGSDPQGPDEGQEKVLRGGSWSDCADVQTVSFRMSGGIKHGHCSPNIGFRLARQEIG
jgi:sulfatase modifying factor 1